MIDYLTEVYVTNKKQLADSSPNTHTQEFAHLGPATKVDGQSPQASRC